MFVLDNFREVFYLVHQGISCDVMIQIHSVVLWMKLFVVQIREWNAMKFSGWRQPNDAKALNHTEKKNPTTVFNMLLCVLHNGSKCVCQRICGFLTVYMPYLNFASFSLAWLLRHLLWARAKAWLSGLTFDPTELWPSWPQLWCGTST